MCLFPGRARERYLFRAVAGVANVNRTCDTELVRYSQRRESTSAVDNKSADESGKQMNKGHENTDGEMGARQHVMLQNAQRVHGPTNRPIDLRSGGVRKE